ncbi:MAG: IclR family transcriptional regulator [Spirochaetaceae bacterium]
MSINKSDKLNKSSTVAKAFLLLEHISQNSNPVSLNQLTELTGFDKTTTYRFLMTLVELGYVCREESSKNFKLSYKVLSLGKNLLRDNEVTEYIKHALEQLCEITGETIHYAVLDGKYTVVTQKVKGSQLVAVDFQIGDRSPISYTSIGKAISTYQSNEFIDSIIAQGIPQITEYTIVKPEQFREELNKIRIQGYAIDDHECSNEMRCIAVPIFEKGGVVRSGISISGPDSRFTIKKLKSMSIPMKKIANELSQKLGGMP